MADAPLFLIHPFPMDARFWQPMLDEMSHARRVVAHELPGFGDAPLRGDWSIRGAAETVAERIANEAPDGRAIVVGLSMGGYVALALASGAPARLAALVLADTRAEADDDAARDARGQAISTIRTSGVETFLDGALPNMVSPRASGAVLAQIRKIASDQGPEALIAAMAALRGRPDRIAELPEIDVPTLVVVGRDDTVTPYAAAATLAESIPGAQFAAIADAGHLAAIEQPRDFATALGRFIAGV